MGRTSSQKTSLLSSTHPHLSLAPCPQQRLPKHPVLLICRTHHPSNDFFPICLPRWGGGSAELGQSLSFTIQSLHAGPEAKLQMEALDLGSPTLLSLPTLNNPALHWGSILFYPTTASPLPPPPGPFGWGIGYQEHGLGNGGWAPASFLDCAAQGRGSDCQGLRRMLPTLKKHFWMDD